MSNAAIPGFSFWIPLVVVLCLLATNLGWTDDARPKAPALPEETSAKEDLTSLLESLSGDDFAKRQHASLRLLAAGEAGMNAVSEKADSDDLELSIRCVSILEMGLKAVDYGTKTAARQALIRLTKSTRKSVAQHALRALQPEEENAQQPVRRGRGIPPNIFPGFNNNRAANPAFARRRTMNINSNGKSIQIQEAPEVGVKVTITETINGDKFVKIYSARDEAELQKDYPEGHQLYAKYINGFNVNPAGVAVGGIPPFNAGAPVRAVNPFRAGEFLQEVETLQAELERLNARLENATKAEKVDVEELKAVQSDLKNTLQKLDAARKKVN